MAASAHLAKNALITTAADALPANATVKAGENRLFVLARFGWGSPGTITPPTLGAQAAGATGVQSSGNLRLDWWAWYESAIQSAGVAKGKDGSPALAAYAETGSTVDRLWIQFTVRNANQGVAYSAWGTSLESNPQQIPDVNLGSTFALHKSQSLALNFIAVEPASLVIGKPTGMRKLGQVARTNYIVWIGEGVEGDEIRYQLDLDTVPNITVGGSLFIPSTEGESWRTAVTRRPQFRSVDARTIADRYNQGTADQEDYIFPSGRKFYQQGQEKA